MAVRNRRRGRFVGEKRVVRGIGGVSACIESAVGCIRSIVRGKKAAKRAFPRGVSAFFWFGQIARK